MSRRLSALVLSALALACSDGRERALPPGPRDPARNLDLLESFADRTIREGQLAAWKRSLGLVGVAPPFGERPLRDLQAEEIAALRAALPGAKEQRRIDQVARVARLASLGADPRAKDALARLDALRSRLPLDDLALHRVLLESDDEGERKDAWFRLNAGTDELAPLVVELTRARREWALRQGHDTALAALDEVSGRAPATARAIGERVQAALLPPPDAPLLEPWNDEAFDAALAARLAAALPASSLVARAEGFASRLDAVPSEVTVGADLTGYSSNASFAIDPPRDVRLRVATEAGLAGAWRVFHEFGHAAQARLAPPGATAMGQRCLCRAVSEGAAKLFERLPWSPEWLSSMGVAEDDVARVGDWEARSERARGRRILADSEFERVLHEEPEAALDALYRASWAAVAGLRSPPEVSAWAAQRSLSHAPGERLDYLLARCAQAAIYRRLRAQPGGLLGAEATRLLRDEILPAAAGSTYEDWFEASTGEAANCEAWLVDVARVAR